MSITEEQEKLISKYGYVVTKIDPLTLVHEEGGIATRKAARTLIESLCLNQVMNKRLHQLEARLNGET